MKTFLKLLIAAFTILTIVLLVLVIREWSFQFDAHGQYFGTDGSIHLESTTEKNQFYCLLSLLILCTGIIIYYRKVKA